MSFLAGDLQLEAHFQLFATSLLPIAANAIKLLAAERNLVAKLGSDASAAFEVSGNLLQ